MIMNGREGFKPKFLVQTSLMQKDTVPYKEISADSNGCKYIYIRMYNWRCLSSIGIASGNFQDLC
jgi:hypothetical protein